MDFLISSYKTNGKSIGYFNEEFGKYKELDYLDLIAPSFIINDGDYIYTYDKDSIVSVYSYRINNEKLELVDKMNIPGTSVTHITYSNKHKLLIGCSYNDGAIFVISVCNGKFIRLNSYFKQIEDDRLSRCHCVLLNNDEDTLAVVNIALDSIFLYDVLNGELKFKDVIKLSSGCGPRHAIYNKDNTLMYIMTEYSNEVIVASLETKSIIQKITTIPNFDLPSYGATLLFSNDYKYLYASNRGEDSIAKFRVTSDGTLNYVNSFSCGGKHPRHMVISRDGKYIISCNKDSNNVTFIDLLLEEVVLDIPYDAASGVSILKG